MSEQILEMLKENQTFTVGVAVAVIAVVVSMFLTAFRRSEAALDPVNWKKFRLSEKIVVSPNAAIYRFELKKNQVIGLPIGQHISVSATIDGKVISRSYTPTSSDDDRGYFDLLVKSYPTGNISKYIGELKIGDYVNIRGPKGQMTYSPSYAKNIGMIAGGTGITPMLQIIRATLKNFNDKTHISLMYANVNEVDILLKHELDELAAEHPHQFKVYYVLNNPPAEWNGGVGFITQEMIEKHLPAPGPDTKILMCGPPPMINGMKKYVTSIGFEAPRTVSKLPDQVFVF